MKIKWLKLILPVIGIGAITVSTMMMTSCSQNGLSPATISKIMQVYKNEASAHLTNGIINVGNIGNFPPHTPTDEDIQYWNNPNAKQYEHVTEDAVAWSNEIVAPMKTWINNNVKEGKNLLGNEGLDPNIIQIPGYQEFREDYFSVHLSNIKAIDKTEDPVPADPNWIFNREDDWKPFKCLQNENDNKQWRKDRSYQGTEFVTEDQDPGYGTDEQKKSYQELVLPHLWNDELFDQGTKTPNFIPYSKDDITVVGISYLVTFSPKPFAEEAPPVAFYVNAELRCSGIS